MRAKISKLPRVSVWIDAKILSTNDEEESETLTVCKESFKLTDNHVSNITLPTIYMTFEMSQESYTMSTDFYIRAMFPNGVYCSTNLIYLLNTTVRGKLGKLCISEQPLNKTVTISVSLPFMAFGPYRTQL